MIAVLFPGQGAQTPGMLAPWLDIPAVAAHLRALSEATDIDLLAHGTTSDADTIRDTAVAQPLLVATGLATARELLGSTTPGLVAGHSVGELGAAALAGVIDDAEAMRLVSVRARAMAAAAAGAEPTSMAAVLGGVEEEVLERLEQLGLTPANMNGGGQIVAAGATPGIEALAADPPARARVIPLQVAGAFHTSYMQPAVTALSDATASAAPNDPATTLLTNADGTTVTSGDEGLNRIVAQVANPVRWDLCQARMLDLGVTAIIEVAPGGVLTGLAKRSLKGVPAVALKTPDDLPAARELLEQHA
ncbi:ACP S-malonyltransferase [Demequina muriae]|uniref:[acyl-carrier-protein] S-malonyltransferase n=1 Tax=Demequina muriae TaxID=3051664 RepID=A0ABT8GJ80_9MICO|nr:ACP S-malonyltransferase [Demequina sp. EGI L300058]MDN4481487.1 ACP S-malonyltransferase [Demequina sp. EGI L300058]